MDLYLIRHAEAVPPGEQGAAEDADRPLTERGKTLARSLGETLSTRDVRLDKLVSSPLLRARQTAESILNGWNGPKPDLVVCDDLAPGGKRKKLARFLRQLGGAAMATVSHQPDIDAFASWLIGSKKAQLKVAKAGVAHIVCDDAPSKGAGTLVWLLTPDWAGTKKA